MKLSRNNLHIKVILAGLLFGTCLLGAALAQDTVLNLYTARHYSTDEAFYTGYTKATGIKINRIEGGEELRPRAFLRRRFLDRPCRRVPRHQRAPSSRECNVRWK